MKDEINRDMILMGCKSLKELNRSKVTFRKKPKMKIAKNVNRLGTEAVYSIFAKTKKLAKQGKKIIDLSLGQSDFKSPKHVVDATIQALKDGHHGYTLPNGIIECREAVSRKIKSLYNAKIDPERIVIMPGGKPTMHYAISFFWRIWCRNCISRSRLSYL